MKIYQHPLSPNCRKVTAVAQHLGIETEDEFVDLLKGGAQAPEFLAINPNGKVPALVDGETTLSESNAIIAYLGAQKDNTLWPKNNSRYDIMKWMSWEACHFAPPVGKLIGQFIFAPMRGGEPNQEIVESALKDFRKYAAVANGQLESTPYLCGENVTLADFTVGAWMSYEQVCKLPVSEYPHLQRWWGDLQKQPGGAALQIPQP